MLKIGFVAIFCLSFVGNAVAQKGDTTIYYLKNSGQLVRTLQRADYYIDVIAHDKDTKGHLFAVKAFYKDGHPKFRSCSMSRADMLYQGAFTGYYDSGQISGTKTYDKGVIVGDVITYYPNGKLYQKANYKSVEDTLLMECRDSTGTVFAEKGNGKWVDFDSDFKIVIASGPVADGQRDGDWHYMVNGTESIQNYSKGQLITPRKIAELAPEFPGGMAAFYQFVGQNLHYPEEAKKRLTQGKVTVHFVVQSDGSVADVKVTKGLGDGCDEEALRVMRLSPAWKPAMQNGKAVSVDYNVPVAFTLALSN